MTILLASIIDATVILAIGLALALALKRRSAAARHAVLTISIACAMLMPVLELLVPQLPVVRWIDTAVVRSSGLRFSSDAPAVLTNAVTVEPNASSAATWPVLAAWVWAAGALLALIGLVLDLWRLHKLRASCTPVPGRWRAQTETLARECGVAGQVQVLQSDNPTLLVTCGLFRPGIILPAGAADWTDERQRIVLRHELAHIRRHDAAIQVVGEVLRVMQPLNPLVWVACRRLRHESEFACDDAVLVGGVEATEYATHLLDVATRLSGRQTSWAAAPAIAHPSTLERRIVAMLDQQKNRQPLTRAAWRLAAVLALGVSLPLAAVGMAPQPVAEVDHSLVSLPAPNSPTAASVETPRPANVARPAQTSFSGQIQDQTGGRIPGATVTLTNQQTQDSYEVVTNAAGAFQFVNLPRVSYELVAQLSGFRRVRVPVDLSAGTPTILTVTLPIGALSEQINVRCGSGNWSVLQMFFPTLSAQESSSAPIRIGGSIKPPQKIRDVRPVCPAGGVTGEVVVLLEGRVGEDGLVTDINSVSGEGSLGGADAVPAALVESAKDAVRQWKFTPTLLNNVPVEVVITISVRYTEA